MSIARYIVETCYENVYSQFLDQFLDDGLFESAEEDKLVEYQSHFELSISVLNRNGALDKAVRASILRDLINGENITGRVKISGNLPFKLMKSEELIAVMKNVKLSEQRVHTEYKGKSSGLSIKIAKGVYYRTSGFKGKPIKNLSMDYIDVGLLALTTKHIYFASKIKNFRIRYDRIVAVKPYSDGVGIQKDGVSSKPMIFSNIDGWFCYNFL